MVFATVDRIKVMCHCINVKAEHLASSTVMQYVAQNLLEDTIGVLRKKFSPEAPIGTSRKQVELYFIKSSKPTLWIDAVTEMVELFWILTPPEGLHVDGKEYLAEINKLIDKLEAKG